MADDKPFIVSDSELVDDTDDEISDEVMEMPDGEVIDHDRIPMSDDKPFIVSDSELEGVTDDDISDEVIEMPDEISDEDLEAPSTPRRKEKDVEKKSIKPCNTFSIRERVRDTLYKEMAQRMSENTGPTLNDDEIKQFAFDTEIELYELFKDVGVKYKSRYRSLNFNIKDRKNLTLWQKICKKSITPKQLVQLTPEELASQELAEWRDNEVKHELDLIKKSELDLLAANKTYVLKTHKGVKVMESKTAVSTDLDPNVPVEDVVTALNEPAEETPTSKPDSPRGNDARKSIDSELERESNRSRKRGRDTHSLLSEKEIKSKRNLKSHITEEEETRSYKTRSTSRDREVSETHDESKGKTRSQERSSSRSKFRRRSGSKSHDRPTRRRSKSRSRSKHCSKSETEFIKGN